MKSFIHFATDVFGAECLGKFTQLLLDVVDPNIESHIFIWAGLGPPPSSGENFWNRRYPKWDYHLFENNAALLQHDEGEQGGSDYTLDRQDIAHSVKAHWATQQLQNEISNLISNRPVQIFGQNNAFQTAITVNGSLADPGGNAVTLGLLASLADFRSQGIVADLTVYCVLSISPQSYEKTENLVKSRSLIAKGLEDLELYIKEGPGDQIFRSIPVYLVGEQIKNGKDKIQLNRLSQEALMAYTTLAITRSTTHNLPAIFPDGTANAFYIRENADQTVTFANDVFKEASPFCVVGAYGVYCPLDQPVSMLAAGYCEEYIRKLAQQRQDDIPGSPDLSAYCENVVKITKKTEPEIQDSINKIINKAIEEFHKSANQNTGLSLFRNNDPKKDLSSWVNIKALKSLFESVFKNKDWTKLVDWYTYDRMKALPLEDWNGAIDELVEVVNQGFLPRRKLQMNEKIRQLLAAMVDPLNEAVTTVFEKTPEQPVGFSPHIIVRALFCHLFHEIEKEKETIQKLALQQSSDETNKQQATHSQVVMPSRKRLEEKLASIPSPIAISLRIVPIFVLFSLLPLSLPFHLGPLNPTLFRLLSGMVAGGLISYCFFFTQVIQVKMQLLDVFEEWFESYKSCISMADEKLRNGSYAEMLDQMLKLIEWYFLDDKNTKTPIPDRFGIPPRHKKEVDDLNSTPDVLPKSEVFNNYRSRLTASADSFKELQQSLAKHFQPSNIETILPVLTGFDSHFFEDAKKYFIPDSSSKMENLMPMVKRHRLQDKNPCVMPFSASPLINNHEAWRYSFLMADGRKLTDGEFRANSSAFQFFSTVKEVFETHITNKKHLHWWIDEYIQSTGNENKLILNTELYLNYTGLSSPSSEVRGGQANKTTFVMASSQNDQLATSLKWSNDMGKNRLSLCMQIVFHLSAEEVIFVPNTDAPSNLLGRAWKTFQTTPLTDTVFQPVTFK